MIQFKRQTQQGIEYMVSTMMYVQAEQHDSILLLLVVAVIYIFRLCDESIDLSDLKIHAHFDFIFFADLCLSLAQFFLSYVSLDIDSVNKNLLGDLLVLVSKLFYSFSSTLCP